MNSKKPNRRRETTPLYFLILPHVHVLDLAGPLQAFHEAGQFCSGYRIRCCGAQPRVRCAQGLWISDLEVLPEVEADAVVLVPGIDSNDFDRVRAPVEWLQRAARRAAIIGSICSGAFILGRAGLLDGKKCTTHWKVAQRLAAEHPSAQVVRNRLFVRDGKLITSAGIASGIDMALSMIEQQHGPLATARTAREMVVFLRRDGDSDQHSAYLDYRTHLHPGIHRVQDWLAHHPDQRPTLEKLSKIAGMSSRNLTRVFRRATGVTLKKFATELKLEVARNLLFEPTLTVDRVAEECGFSDSRQFRRLWKRKHGATPSQWRRQSN